MSDIPPELQPYLPPGTSLGGPVDGFASQFDSFPVYVGKEIPDRKPINRAFEEGIPGTFSLYDEIVTLTPTDTTRSVAELLTDFYSWDEKKVRTFQERAFAAGLLGNRREDVSWGVRGDDATLKAYSMVLGRAAGFYAANQKLTPDEVLDMMVKGAPESADGGSQKPTITLPNPVDLQRGFEGKAQEVLGRSLLNQDTIERFVRTAQGESQRFQQAQIDGATTNTAPASPEALAERQLREEFAVEASAHDVATQFETFLRIIFGGPR